MLTTLQRLLLRWWSRTSRRTISARWSGLRFASQTKIEPLVDLECCLVSIAILHLRDEVEVIASALALAVVTEPAVLREGHFEYVLTGAFMNRARAFESIPVASAAHVGREAIVFEHLLKRHSGLDDREVDEWFCHVMIMSLVFAGCLRRANTSAAHGIRRPDLAGVDGSSPVCRDDVHPRIVKS